MKIFHFLLSGVNFQCKSHDSPRFDTFIACFLGKIKTWLDSHVTSRIFNGILFMQPRHKQQSQFLHQFQTLLMFLYIVWIQQARREWTLSRLFYSFRFSVHLNRLFSVVSVHSMDRSWTREATEHKILRVEVKFTWKLFHWSNKVGPLCRYFLRLMKF